jgi:hypothetical protein
MTINYDLTAEDLINGFRAYADCSHGIFDELTSDEAEIKNAKSCAMLAIDVAIWQLEDEDKISDLKRFKQQIKEYEK